jgi:hypothetical protein
LDQSVDGTISQAATEGFAAWKRHDDAASDFCDLHGEKAPFVSLIFSTISLLSLFLLVAVSYFLTGYTGDPRVADPHHCNVDPETLLSLMQIRIRLLTLIWIRLLCKVMRICKHWYLDPPVAPLSASTPPL